MASTIRFIMLCLISSVFCFYDSGSDAKDVKENPDSLCLKDRIFVDQDLFLRNENLQNALDVLSEVTDNVKSLQLSQDDSLFLNECTHAFLSTLFAEVNKLDFSRIQNSNKELSSLYWNTYELANYVGAKLKKFLAEKKVIDIVQNEKLYTTYLKHPYRLSLRSFKNFLSLNPSDEELKKAEALLVNFYLDWKDVYDPDLPNAVENHLNEIASEISVAGTSRDKKFISKLYAVNIFRNAFEFTEDAYNEALRKFEYEKGYLSRLGAGTTLTEAEITRILQQISEMQKRIEKLRARQPLSIPKFVDLLAGKIGNAAGDEAKEIFLSEIKKARDIFQSQYLNPGLQMKEGDLVLSVTNGDLGDIFTELLGVKSFAGHIALVSKNFDEGYPFYFISEVVLGFSKSNLATRVEAGDFLFLRPDLEIQSEFTKRVLENLKTLGTIKFDSYFHEGIFNDAGSPSLYCSEFVHFAFKTLFENGNYVSPFDAAQTRFTPISEMAGMNLQKFFGSNLDQNFFVPDSLIYSSLTFPVGYMLRQFASNEFDEKYLRSNAYILRMFKDELMEKFKNSVLYYLQNFSFRKLLFREKAELEAKWQFYSHVLIKGMPLDLPPGDGRYYALKFFILYADFESLLNRISLIDDSGNTIDDWKEKALAQFENKIEPQIKDFCIK